MSPEDSTIRLGLRQRGVATDLSLFSFDSLDRLFPDDFLQPTQSLGGLPVAGVEIRLIREKLALFLHHRNIKGRRWQTALQSADQV